MTTSSDHLTGKVLGTCKLERLIGRGGMSVVYLAQQTRPSRHVAIKILLPNAPVGSSLHNGFLARFRYEADIIAKLEHIHIIPIFECDEQEGLAYLVMPYLTGGSLREVLTQRGALSLQETLTYIEQAAEALDYAHAHGVIHRDLKPGNFLLHADGRLVLADFGIARIVQGNSNSVYSTLTNTGILLGTPEYMAPEMVLGGQIDPHTDIYELGIVLFQMLTGDLPFRGRSAFEVIEKHLEQSPPLLHQLNPQIPPAVDTVIRKATAKKPSDRYESAKAMADALRNAITTPYYPTVEVPHYAPFVLSSLSTATSEASQPTEYTSRPGNEHPTSKRAQSDTKTSRSSHRRSHYWLVLVVMFLILGLIISGILFASAQGPEKQTRSQTSIPSQQIQTLMKHYYDDINNLNYQAAYNLWGSAFQKSTGYCKFADGFAHTLHDTITLGSITQNNDGTFNVETTVNAFEKLPWGTFMTRYHGYPTVGLENGAWKLLSGEYLPKTTRVATPEPPLPVSSDASPPQQAQALIVQFHNDIGDHDYPAAYNRWGSAFQNTTDYCNFINSYAHTLQDNVLIEQVTALPDGTTQVVGIVNTTVETPTGNTPRSYQETYIVGQENNAWKILRSTPS